MWNNIPKKWIFLFSNFNDILYYNWKSKLFAKTTIAMFQFNLHVFLINQQNKLYWLFLNLNAEFWSTSKWCTYKSLDGKDHKNGISNHCKVAEKHDQIACQPTCIITYYWHTCSMGCANKIRLNLEELQLS